jgi:hypothetical protein
MPAVFWWVNLKEIYYFEDIGFDGRIILIAFQEIRLGSVDWFDLLRKETAGRLMNTVMNVWVT